MLTAHLTIDDAAAMLGLVASKQQEQRLLQLIRATGAVDTLDIPCAQWARLVKTATAKE